MHDGRISLTSTLAWATWALSILCALGTTLVASLAHYTTMGGMVLCTIAIILAAAAATIHVRSFFCKFLTVVRTSYTAGRDRGRDEGRAEVLTEPGAPVQRIH